MRGQSMADLAPAREATGVQSVHRAAALLDALAQRTSGATLTELATATGLHKTTAYRLLATLRSEDLIRYDVVSERYFLGTQLLVLGEGARDQAISTQLVRPTLIKLRDLTKETCHLAVPVDDEMVYVEKVDSDHHTIRIASRVGARMPLHCTALGKAYLAFEPTSRIENYLASAELVARTPFTITDPDQLRQELATVRQQGYAVDERENEEEMRCIGSAVLGRGDQVLAAVSVTAPQNRLQQIDVPRVGEAVRTAAREIRQRVAGGMHE